MITRVDDELHARLKSRAASEGRSVNDLVVEALTALVGQALTREVVRQRARDAGWLVEPVGPVTRPSPEELRAATSGTGHSVSEALDVDRGEW